MSSSKTSTRYFRHVAVMFGRALAAGVAGAVALLLASPVLVASCALRLFRALTELYTRWLEPEYARWQDVAEFEPMMGWRLRAEYEGYLQGGAGEVFDFRSDSDGWRGTQPLSEAECVVVGDSFAMGFGVDERNWFGAHIPGLNVKAIGAPGYNMVQGLLWTERLSEQLRGKLVVWLIYVGNDLYDNLRPHMGGFRTPFVTESETDGGWRIVTSHISPRAWPQSAELADKRHRDMLGHTYSETFQSRRMFAACEFLLRKASSTCERAGAPLAVVSVPDLFELTNDGLEKLEAYSADSASFDPDLPHRRLEEMTSRLGIPYKDAKPFLRGSDYSRGDRHWNELGNRKFARVLRQIHGRYGPPRGMRAISERRMPPELTRAVQS